MKVSDQPHRSIAGYLADLTAGDPLAALAVDDDIAVRGTFDLSYRTLPEPARQMFRRLGLMPCPDFTAAAAAALAGTTEPEARHALDRLAAAHLLVQPAAGRYTLHDLLRRYAAGLAAAEDSPTARAAAVHRLYDWLVAMSVAAAELLYPQYLRLRLSMGAAVHPAPDRRRPLCLPGRRPARAGRRRAGVGAPRCRRGPEALSTGHCHAQGQADRGGHRRRTGLPRGARRADPGGLAHVERYANNPVEADHSQLKRRLRPMRGLQTDRTAQVVIGGHAFIQNLRCGQYELGIEVPAARRVAAAFNELAQAI